MKHASKSTRRGLMVIELIVIVSLVVSTVFVLGGVIAAVVSNHAFLGGVGIFAVLAHTNPGGPASKVWKKARGKAVKQAKSKLAGDKD